MKNIGIISLYVFEINFSANQFDSPQGVSVFCSALKVNFECDFCDSIVQILNLTKIGISGKYTIHILILYPCGFAIMPCI